MSLSQVEKEIEKLQKELLDCNQERKKEIESQIKKQEEYYQHLSPYDHVYLARKSTRPNIKDYINHLFDDFIELHGDRLAKDDGSIVGGIGLFNQQPVTIIGHLKGKTLEDNLKCNFGMSSPEGYRKAMRLMKQAEKFKRPIIAFVDTPGAYPGMEAEMHGIGEAIARNLLEMSLLKVPIITIVIGEGGSGGALALSVSDRLVMLENSVYSILSPEGFASILWKDQEGKRVAELDAELKVLLKHWEDTISKVQKATKLPSLVYEETSRTVAMLRDLFNPSYENIYVNDESVYNEVKDYVTLIAPERSGIVKLYKGQLPIFDNFAITKQIKSSFGKTVSYKSGAYLIIEHTEALHVVDVNSGNRSKSGNGQEANALDVNLGAADELARQLRLRDMGGIIVVDFIDMNLAENRQKLYERMCQNMQKDRAKHNILPLSKFGLMQITRQRVRPAMDVNTDEDCPTCFGKGKIKPSILFTDTLESKIDYLVNKLKVKKFTLHIHPYVAAYINQGIVSLKRKWQMKFGFGIKIIPNQSLAFLEYKFYDMHGDELDMKEEFEIK